MMTQRSEMRRRRIGKNLATRLCARPNFARLLLGIILVTVVPAANAQLPDITGSQKSQPEIGGPNTTTMLPHFVESRIWLSGQMNFIYQTHPPFDAKYSGQHSFRLGYEKTLGRVLTLYSGIRINNSGELLVDLEEAEGLGLSSAFGIAGFTNLHAVRDPTLGSSLTLAG